MSDKFIEIEFWQGDTLRFYGHYRADLERPNWHFYQRIDGALIHCRKEQMVYVVEHKEDEGA